MTRIIAFSFLCFCIVGATFTYSNKKDFKNQKPAIDQAPFDISFHIEKVKNDLYSLSVALDLDSDSYVVSPHSKDTIYGHFDISMKDFGNLIQDKNLVEIPASVEEYDPILKEPVRFARGKTTFKQHIHVLSKRDFEASGLVWFVLEPSCVPYDVEFKISHQSGEMTVQKTKTSISAGYKQ